LRKFAAAVLAVPVLLGLYAPFARRPRIAFSGIGVLAVIVLAVVALDGPGARPAAATLPTAIEPLTAAAFGPAVRTGLASDAALTVTFSRQMDEASVVDALRVAPATPIEVSWNAAGTSVSVMPTRAWLSSTYYTITVGATALNSVGASLAAMTRVAFITAPATVATVARVATQTARAARPAIVRFRPLNGASSVDRAATLSVRFSTAMDRAATAPAFSATANGRPIVGAIRWAEGDTVLVLTPSTALPAGALIRMSVTATARSAAGSVLGAAVTATARTIVATTLTVRPTATVTPKPAPSTPPPSKPTASKPVVPAAGGSAGNATWYAVETYYLKLMNCTRTGGWVTPTGACSSPGGLSTPPLVLDAGLSDRVSRPYAKLLATTGACDHFINGTPTDRLHRAGYSGWAAENIGCRSAPTAYESMVFTQIFFQDEKPCGGYCHYANLMNPAYTRCGIGVWIDHGRIRLVVDFYHS